MRVKRVSSCHSFVPVPAGWNFLIFPKVLVLCVRLLCVTTNVYTWTFYVLTLRTYWNEGGGSRVLPGTQRNSWRSLVCCKMNEIVSYIILRKCNCCSVSQLRPFHSFSEIYIERENDHLCCASLDRLFSSGRNNNAITISHQQTMDSHLSLFSIRVVFCPFPSPFSFAPRHQPTNSS